MGIALGCVCSVPPNTPPGIDLLPTVLQLLHQSGDCCQVHRTGVQECDLLSEGSARYYMHCRRRRFRCRTLSVPPLYPQIKRSYQCATPYLTLLMPILIFHQYDVRNYAGALILAPQEPDALMCVHMRWGVKDELTIPMMEYSFKEQWRTSGENMVCALNKYPHRLG